MPGRYWDEGRGSEDRREYWREGEDIRSAPHESRGRGGPERYAGTRDMDFGGAYGGGRDRGERSWGERGGGREYLGGRPDMDDRWDRERWDRDRAGSRGGGGEDEWRSRQGDFWERDERGELRDWSVQPRDESRGGVRAAGSSPGSWGATRGARSAWGRGGAGYSGSGGGFGGGGSYGGGRYGRGGEESYGAPYPSYGAEFGAQSWRGSSEHEGRGFVERMGDSFREGMAKLTGRGPKGYKRSDDRIREDVCERIARSPINAENVEVQVENGEVTLSGEVESRMDKRRLEDLIDDVFGVDEVHNHLRMRREAQGTSAGTSDDAHGENSGLSH